MGFKPKPIPASTILISFRDEGAGKGAFYDHFTLQHHTAHKTATVCSPSLSTKPLETYLSGQTHNLSYGVVSPTIHRLIPPGFQNLEEGGVLFIPGITRDADNRQPLSHQFRMQFERTIIKQAVQRGMPILAVCAGAWTVWQTVGGALTPVTDHNYGGAMPRVGVNGIIVNNKHVHNVIVDAGTLVADAMGPEATRWQWPVNSVHWKAASPTPMPENFQVCATAKKDPRISIKTRQQTDMSPQEDSIEGFESIYGAPIFGIQWHPEAFQWNSAVPSESVNHRVLLFMAKAGDAYRAKQTMLKEYKSKAIPLQDDDVDQLTELVHKMKLSS
ncbi:MAG TPA: gamma-glutamyl-gamma-aminobutyrate hydrolase family protein [Gammaproteobacteria bacterium]|nr:gamma-glutamyl-gamma-aminobutyrate hydrolase family protein [Gammaproteobacteria bacterium]